jgi:hypothetical protein
LRQTEKRGEDGRDVRREETQGERIREREVLGAGLLNATVSFLLLTRVQSFFPMEPPSMLPPPDGEGGVAHVLLRGNVG